MQNIRPYKNTSPSLDKGVYVDPSAVVIGDVSLGEDVSIWPCATVRGDMHFIRIGARSNVQDNTILHITHASDYNPDGWPLIIGDDVTVGHGACLHGCTIGDRVLVGIASTILDGAMIPNDVVIAAGSLVPPRKKLDSGFLYMGSPVKKIRALTQQEYRFFTYSTKNYVDLKNDYLNQEI